MRQWLNIKTLTGQTIPIEVDIRDTVDTLLNCIYEVEDVPPGSQRLIFKGRQLVAGQDLSVYNIPPGSVLHLVLATSGGGKRARYDDAGDGYETLQGQVRRLQQEMLRTQDWVEDLEQPLRDQDERLRSQQQQISDLQRARDGQRSSAWATSSIAPPPTPSAAHAPVPTVSCSTASSNVPQRPGPPPPMDDPFFYSWLEKERNWSRAQPWYVTNLEEGDRCRLCRPNKKARAVFATEDHMQRAEHRAEVECYMEGKPLYPL